MPFIPFEVSLQPGVMAGFWKIQENESYFRERLILWPEEQKVLSSVRAENKRLQWLASRLVIRELKQPRGQVISISAEDGKPLLKGLDVHVSISHTETLAAAILSEDLLPGIDVEDMNRDIPSVVRKRFLHRLEFQHIHSFREDQAGFFSVLAWSAKETMFKVLGRKGVSFQEDLLLHLPEQFPEKRAGAFPVSILNHGPEKKFDLHFTHFENTLCTWLLVPPADFTQQLL